ncbi:S8 family serine peptidase [Larkinella punicea]|uniref:S8 family peptidase n=1 Tax=Larkinella punicea TaxID=2315727 RepID=A0A368JIZ6_9BACT|nr:S8 family serine peptidase [Larkinella punicea]RCR66101.1 S8 family peptidase [Larkinella punicea]
MRWTFLSTCSVNVAILSLLIGCQSDQDAIGPAGDCLVQSSVTNGQAIAGSYIVTYKSTENLPVAPNARVGAAVQQLLTRHGLNDPNAQVLFSGESTGFLAHVSAAEAETLKADPSVELVEPDRIISICSCVDVAVTSTLTWNVRQTGYGRGDLNPDKTAWILDTGIDLDHPDLNVDTGRSQSFLTGKTADDENGHGTHIAGIIGALNNNIGVTGVASGATLVALRVLDNEGEGKLSALVQAVSYVNINGKAGDVVNISIGGEGTSASLERVIKQAADKGILFAIAAGNEGESAEKYAPANVNHANVFTVSAMDQSGNFASFSNFGPTVDICAYGVRITSTYLNGRYASLSGTSMASPHVAGLLLIRGRTIPTNGFVRNDPDGTPDPIAGGE